MKSIIEKLIWAGYEYNKGAMAYNHFLCQLAIVLCILATIL